jgi:hypothetical protein
LLYYFRKVIRRKRKKTGSTEADDAR